MAPHPAARRCRLSAQEAASYLIVCRGPSYLSGVIGLLRPCYFPRISALPRLTPSGYNNSVLMPTMESRQEHSPQECYAVEYEGKTRVWGDGPPAFTLSLSDPSQLERILHADDYPVAPALIHGELRGDRMAALRWKWRTAPSGWLARLFSRVARLAPSRAEIWWQSRRTLEEAQEDRLNRICRALDLRSGDLRPRIGRIRRGRPGRLPRPCSFFRQNRHRRHVRTRRRVPRTCRAWVERLRQRRHACPGLVDRETYRTWLGCRIWPPPLPVSKPARLTPSRSWQGKEKLQNEYCKLLRLRCRLIER